MIVVPDAGPIICLAGAGQLDVLDKLFAEVVVPRVVFDEVVVAGAGLTGADEAQAATWLKVVDAGADPTLLDRLGRGEAAAIPLAERLNATLLVDDAVVGDDLVRVHDCRAPDRRAGADCGAREDLRAR